MKKAELLTDLASKPDVVDVNTPVLLDTVGNVKKYDIPVVLDRGNDLVVGASQPVITIDEGEPTEAAYYNARKVFSVSVTNFRDEAQTQADSFEGKPHGGATIIKVVVDNIYADRKAALATAYKDDGSNVSALLYKNPDDTWANPQILQ